MVNIFQASLHCSKILAREEVFRPAFIPKVVLHRKAEIQKIADTIRPLMEGRTPENLFIYGDSGTGKTATVQYVLRQLGEHTSRTKAIYVNCWQHHTRMEIYSLIASAIGEILPRRGLATDEVFERILEAMGRENLRCVIVLDELDGLLFHKEGKFLHDIARAANGQPRFSLIGISNNADALDGLDARIDSSVGFYSLEFRRYNRSEMADILSQRAEGSLAANSWGAKVIDACAVRAVLNKGGAHLGLEMLLKATREAERGCKLRIGLEDVETASDALGVDDSAPSLMVPESSLAKGEKLVMELLDRDETDPASLYSAFRRKMRKSPRQIRNYVRSLQARGLVAVCQTSSHSGGRKLVKLGVLA